MLFGKRSCEICAAFGVTCREALFVKNRTIIKFDGIDLMHRPGKIEDCDLLKFPPKIIEDHKRSLRITYKQLAYNNFCRGWP